MKTSMDECDTRTCMQSVSTDCRFLSCNGIHVSGWKTLKQLADPATFMKIFKLSFGKGHVFALLLGYSPQLLIYSRPRNEALVHDLKLMFFDVADADEDPRVFSNTDPNADKLAIDLIAQEHSSEYMSLMVNSFDEVALDDWFGVLVDELMRDLKQPKEDQYLTELLDYWVEKGETEGENLIEAFHNGCGHYIEQEFMPPPTRPFRCSKDEVPPHILHMNDDTIRADRFCPVGTRRRKEMINKHVKLGFQTSLRFDEYGAMAGADEETHHSSRFTGCCKEDTAGRKAWRQVKYSLVRDALRTSEEYEANERAKSEDAKKMMDVPADVFVDAIQFSKTDEINLLKFKAAQDTFEEARRWAARTMSDEKEIKDKIKKREAELAELEKQHKEIDGKMLWSSTQPGNLSTFSQTQYSEAWANILSQAWRYMIKQLRDWLKEFLPKPDDGVDFPVLKQSAQYMYHRTIDFIMDIAEHPQLWNCATKAVATWKERKCTEISSRLGLVKLTKKHYSKDISDAVSQTWDESAEWVKALGGPGLADTINTSIAAGASAVASFAYASGWGAPVGIGIGIVTPLITYSVDCYAETLKVELTNQMYINGIANFIAIIRPDNCIKERDLEKWQL